MRLTDNPRRDVPIVLVIVGLLTAVLWPVHTGDPVSKTTLCLNNLKQLSTGLMIYAGDADERFPPRDLWMDALAPYAKYESLYRCPVAPKGAYGYAFNAALSTAKPPKDAATTPEVYDSVNPIRNASDLVASLPSPGRHQGRDYVAYADGHARRVAP